MPFGRYSSVNFINLCEHYNSKVVFTQITRRALWLPKSPTNSKHLSPIIHSCYCSLYFISSSFQRLIGSFPDSLLSHPSSRMTTAFWLFPHSYHMFLPTCAFPVAYDWLNLWLSLFFKKERKILLESTKWKVNSS